MNKVVNEFLNAIDKKVNIAITGLQFNRTYFGVVQSHTSGVAKVLINGNIYECTYVGQLADAQIVRVIAPNNQFNQLYIDGLKYEDDRPGGVDTATVIRLIASHNTEKAAHEDIRAAIPTKTSQLINDSGFITKADIPDFPEMPEMPNLAEYYKKTETYNKKEVNDAMATKSDITHDHSQLYYAKAETYAKDEVYTKGEVNTELGKKSSVGHNHDDSYYTKGLVYLKTETYSQEEIDKKIAEAGVVDLSAYYTKLEVDAELKKKSNTGHLHNDTYYTKLEVYTKAEVDALIPSLPDMPDLTAYYTRLEVDTLLGLKSDKTHNHDTTYRKIADSYSQSEVDTRLFDKSDRTHDHLAIHYTKDEVYAKVETYNKTEIDKKIDDVITGGEVDLSNYYTKLQTYNKSEVDTALGGKSDTGHNHSTLYYTKALTYSKIEIDALMDTNVPDLSNYYTKAETNTELAKKANTVHNHDAVYYTKQLTYSKEEIDGLLGLNVPDLSKYYTKVETDTALGLKSDKTHNHDAAYMKVGSAYSKHDMDTKLIEKANANHNHLDTHYTKNETYSKLETYNRGEIDTKITDAVTGGQVDLGNYYTKQEVYNKGEVDTELTKKSNTGHLHSEYAGVSTVYTKKQVDDALVTKSNTNHNHNSVYPLKDSVFAKTETYSQAQANALLDNKADKSTTYTKAAVNAELDKKSNATHNHDQVYAKIGASYLKAETYPKETLYTKSEVDDKIGGAIEGYVPDFTNYYKKTETYNQKEVDDKIAGSTVDMTTYYKKTETYSQGEVNTRLNLKADKTTTYTKTEVDKLLPVVDVTKAYVDLGLAGKSDSGHHHDTRYYQQALVYNKTEVDKLFGESKPDFSGYYTKVETDTALGLKSDKTHNHDAAYYTKSATYNQTEINNKLKLKSDTTHNHDATYEKKGVAYTRAETNTELAKKSNTGHVHDERYYTQALTYNRSEIDSLVSGSVPDLGVYYKKSESDARYSLKGLMDAEYKEFVVGGDANTYYPVVFSYNGKSTFSYHNLDISRGYSWQAPDTWNTATHRGGLTLSLLWNGDGYWGGNSSDSYRVSQFVQTYTTMVGGIDNTTTGLVVWLRGGSAMYRVASSVGNRVGYSIKLSTYTDAANRTFSPRTNVNAVEVEVNSRFNIRGKQLYDTNNRVYSPINKPSPADIGASASNHNHDTVYYTKALTYSRSELDALLNANIPDLSGHYTKKEVDDKLKLKSDASHNHDTTYEKKGVAYTKAAMDTLLGKKSDTGHNHDTVYYTKLLTYSKAQIDALVGESVPDLSVYYTKTAVDDKLKLKSDTTHNHDATYEKKGVAYTKGETNDRLALKADKNHTHGGLTDDRLFAEYSAPDDSVFIGFLDPKNPTKNRRDYRLAFGEDDEFKNGLCALAVGYFTAGTVVADQVKADGVYEYIADGFTTRVYSPNNKPSPSDIGASSTGHTHSNLYYTKNETYAKTEVYNRNETYSRAEINNQITIGQGGSFLFDDLKGMRNVKITTTFHSNGNVTENAIRTTDSVQLGQRTTQFVNASQIKEIDTIKAVVTGTQDKTITRTILFGAGTMTETIT